ncbi:MAG: slipin family protein [Armatimonadetes bacterium]|nr:slipin family protein [Armatimonadota bacterium]
MHPVAVVFAVIGGFLFLFLLSGIRIVNEYERGVVFRLGRLVGARGPGIFYVIPIIERMVKMDLRVVALDVPKQEVITRDNVTVRVNAVCYFRVFDPCNAVVQVQHYWIATSQMAQTTLRSVLGECELDHLLSDREAINHRLQKIIDEATDPWGVKVTAVEVKDVELPTEMQRAIARQAEAEREKRAKIIAAEGEFQASKQLAEAAKIIGATPPSLQLRFLQTLAEIATENNSTTIFPVPIDLFEAFLKRTSDAPASDPPAAPTM